MGHDAGGSPDYHCGQPDDNHPRPYHIHGPVEQVQEPDCKSGDSNHKRRRMPGTNKDEDRDNARDKQDRVYHAQEQVRMYHPPSEHRAHTAEQQLEPERGDTRWKRRE